MNDLDKYNFSTEKGFNPVLLKLRYDDFKKYFKGDSCLEFGCADGEGTKILLRYFDKVVAVDGSEKLINKAKNKIKNKKAVFICSLFEKFKINEKFDVIVLAHILEHVENPVQVLKSAKEFLKKDGIMIIDVPNAKSIHRQIGVLMGMIESEYSLNDADLSIGHRRVYDLKLLKEDVKKAGLRKIYERGVFMKPFSNKQMDKFILEC
jgi:2-polyprenyl-3-methyl-5-hydroxy-6-metoxy-1,4-benzoquinol methylase